jgi:hypothetical protein
VSAYARSVRPADTTTFAITRVLRHALAPPPAASAGPQPALVEQADAIGVLSVGEADWLRATAVLLDTPVPVIPLDLGLEAAATT